MLRMKLLFFLIIIPIFSNETLSKNFWIKNTSEFFYFFIPEIDNQKILFKTYTPELSYYFLIFIIFVFNLTLLYFLINLSKKKYFNSTKLSIFTFIIGLFFINPLIYLTYLENIETIELNQFSQKIIIDKNFSLPISSLEKISVQKLYGKSKKTKEVNNIFYKILIFLKGIGEIEIFTSRDEKVSFQVSIELAKILGVELFHYEKKIFEKNNSYITIDENFIQNLKPVNLFLTKKDNSINISLNRLEKNLFYRNLLLGIVFILIGVSCLIPAFKNSAKGMIFLGSIFILIGLMISSSIFYLTEFNVKIDKDSIYLERKFYGKCKHQFLKKDILKIQYSKNNLIFILKGGEKFLNPEFDKKNLSSFSDAISNVKDYLSYIREFNVDGLGFEDRLFLFYQFP